MSIIISFPYFRCAFSERVYGYYYRSNVCTVCFNVCLFSSFFISMDCTFCNNDNLISIRPICYSIFMQVHYITQTTNIHMTDFQIPPHLHSSPHSHPTSPHAHTGQLHPTTLTNCKHRPLMSTNARKGLESKKTTKSDLLYLSACRQFLSFLSNHKDHPGNAASQNMIILPT